MLCSFFFNDTATTEIYTLSLHDALPILVFESVGLATGFPYGEYTYSDDLGPTLLGVPFLVPLAWLMMAWPSWLLARRLTRDVRAGRRHPARVAVAAAVFAGGDVVLDPQTGQAGHLKV